MVTKRNFVQDFRQARQSDIDKMTTYEVKVPVYSESLIESLNLDSVTADELKRTLAKQKPKNEITNEKPVSAGFVSLFDVLNNGEKQYTDVSGVWVRVLGVLEGQKVAFEGTIYGQNDLIVGVRVAESDTVILCPIQASCWFFN